MIEKLEELQLAARTRQSIIDLVAGVMDASGLAWNDQSPNWLTHSRIAAVVAELERGLARLGALPIEAHGPCGGSGHASRASRLGKSSDYWCIGLQGRPEVALEPVKKGSGAFRFDGRLYEVDLNTLTTRIEASRAPCPCRPGIRSDEHSLCRHFGWPVEPTSSLQSLAAIHCQISEAAHLATAKRTRSTIREQLLVALIEVERLMVAETAAQHASRRLNPH